MRIPLGAVIVLLWLTLVVGIQLGTANGRKLERMARAPAWADDGMLERFTPGYEVTFALQEAQVRAEAAETPCGQLAFALRAAGWVEALVPMMTAIGAAESGCRPGAVHEGLRERSVGPLQINVRAHPWVSEWCAYDYVCAARAALYIYQRQGLRAWTSYRIGAHRPFLPVR